MKPEQMTKAPTPGTPKPRHQPRPRPETVRKREDILKAAMEIFGSKGYSNAPLTEIAERVGITHAGVLHHFGTKQNLLLEAVRYRDIDDVAGLKNKHMPGGIEQFEHLIQTAVRNTHRIGIVQAFVVLSAEAVTEDHPARDYFRSRYQILRKDISDNFRALCAERGIEDDKTIDQAAASILAVMDGLQYQWLMEPAEVDLSEATEFAIRAIARAVLGAEAFDEQ